jgi:uncharacterized membrane protein
MNNSLPKSVDLPTREPASPETVGLPPTSLPGNAAGDLPQRIGDFTILRILGEGGMGTVYLAEDVRLGRKAAIKTMKLALATKPENRVRFVREARAAAAVEYDNIVPVWQVGEAADGSPFIAMPFLHGEMLDARLKREPIQPLGVILKVAREVSDGLAAAHARGLIHRDIKPGNVWIEGDPESKDLARQVRRCKILDFGLARSVENEDVQVSASGTILGTPAFMAPEQASGEKVDHRADLFSLGVMLYRMSTGRLPFAGPNPMAVLTALATVTPPPTRTLNRNLPRALSDLIDRLLSKNPARRPQSAEEVAAAVRQIAANLSGDTVLIESETAPRPRAKAWRGRTPLLVALALLVLAPLGWWLATVILRVETENGTLVVEINDAETEARIRDGKLILTGPDDKVLYTLSPSEHDKKIDTGPYKIRVEGADGLTLDVPEFTLKKGDMVTVRVTMDPKSSAKNLDPDRKAADWVLSIGGVVRVNNQERDIKTAADLPPGAFQLTAALLLDNKHVSDAGLGHFKDCKSLTVLNLDSTKVSDAGLAYFKDCKNLTALHLRQTQVSDVGMAYFKDCKNLTVLYLGNTQVSDEGMAYFKDCKNLTILDLSRTRVSDAGLSRFEGCKNLGFLYLDNTQVSDAGLDYFKDYKNLTELGLSHTEVSDAGLAHFRDCKNLTSLDLGNTQVSDAGLAYFKDCKNLTILFLGNTQVSDAGLVHFKDCKNLTLLALDSTQVSDAGLVHFQGCKNLGLLYLNNTQASDAGLDYFKDCKNLTYLNLQKTKVTRAKVEELKKALPRCKIEWYGGVIEPGKK